MLWDVASRRPLGPTSPRQMMGVTSVRFNPRGDALATGADDGTAQLWNLARPGGPWTPHGASLPATGSVEGLAFRPDGKILAAATQATTIDLWDTATGQEIGQPLTGHTGSVTSVAFSPDGTLLAVGGADHTVRLWDVGLVSWTNRACAIAGRNFSAQERQQHLGTVPYPSACPALP